MHILLLFRWLILTQLHACVTGEESAYDSNLLWMHFPLQCELDALSLLLVA